MEAPPADLFKMPVGYKNAGPFKRQFLFKGASSIMDEVAQDLGPRDDQMAEQTGDRRGNKDKVKAADSRSKGKTGNGEVSKGR